jgi:secreted PhoX family phosphatase
MPHDNGLRSGPAATRRHFLKTAAAFSLGFAGLHKLAAGQNARTSIAVDGFGPLLSDPRSVLDLPKGFEYRVVARAGATMTDGFIVPARQDGMAAFPGSAGHTILVCNHEVSTGSSARNGPFGNRNELFRKLDGDLVYDKGRNDQPCLGGTTTMVYDTRSRRLVRSFLSLAGTIRNCAGGPTPWNSWITCEETVERAGGVLDKDHGYCFDVPATSEPAIAEPKPLKDMGRFNHEAVAVDPVSGIVYQTEDRDDGLIYRFIPRTRNRLAEGGRLQALAIDGRPRMDTRNWVERAISTRAPLDVTWIDLDDVDASDDDLRHRGFEKSASRFARGEGMWYGRNAVYFACTNGGRARKGQIWRYTTSPHEGTAKEKDAPGKLELFIEPDDGTLVENADNVTVTPWGDLILCEDGSRDQYLVGVTPEGSIYKFGRNAISSSEFAGATFSPDGTTLFVNIQGEGLTLAITGPWSAVRTSTSNG